LLVNPHLDVIAGETQITGNTDGNGLMKYNLKENYKINLSLMRMFTEGRLLRSHIVVLQINTRL
jgi:hypothetical protein